MAFVVVLANEEKTQEFTMREAPEHKIEFVYELDEFLRTPADVFIDLLFENDKTRIEALKDLNRLVIIDSVVNTIKDLQAPFVRINAWTGFLSQVIEGSCLRDDLRPMTEAIFDCFDKKIEWLPDEPGFVTPRIITMIVNEAYFALEEGVSTKDEIDIAMKLGTAYPFGPFEWSQKIGLTKILHLLNQLKTQEPRYQPAPLLVKEAGQS